MPPKRFSRVSASMPNEKREKFDKKLEEVGLNRNVFINTKIEEFIKENGSKRLEGVSRGHTKPDETVRTVTINGEEYYY